MEGNALEEGVGGRESPEMRGGWVGGRVVWWMAGGREGLTEEIWGKLESEREVF